jgi:radical SAM protein with 4Fe4S-binding SPASM domain
MSAGAPLCELPRRPVTCIWEITGACELRCVHCATGAGVRGPRELSFEQACGLIADLARLGCRTLEITGGEPLLRPDWDRLCRHATQAGLDVALITSGARLDEATLARALDAGVGHLGISLDGPRNVHDRLRPFANGRGSSWDAAFRALALAAPRIRTTAITAVSRANVDHLAAVHDQLAALGVQRWQVQLVVPTGRVREAAEDLVLHPNDLPPLADRLVGWIAAGHGPAVLVSDTIGYFTEREKLLRRRPGGQGVWIGCMAGIRSVAVGPGGTVRGCSMLPPEFDAGDLHEESFPAIWADAARFGCAVRLDPGTLAGGCRGCKWGALCRAGCNSMSYWTTGTVHDNPYCLHRLEEARG